jgi:hypothetical protein
LREFFPLRRITPVKTYCDYEKTLCKWPPDNVFTSLPKLDALRPRPTFAYQGRLDENGTNKFIIVNPPTGNRFYASSNHELESSIRDAEISELKQRLSDLEKRLRYSANPKDKP